MGAFREVSDEVRESIAGLRRDDVPAELLDAIDRDWLRARWTVTHEQGHTQLTVCGTHRCAADQGRDWWICLNLPPVLAVELARELLAE